MIGEWFRFVIYMAYVFPLVNWSHAHSAAFRKIKIKSDDQNLSFSIYFILRMFFFCWSRYILMKIKWKLIREILGNWYAKPAGYWLPIPERIYSSFCLKCVWLRVFRPHTENMKWARLIFWNTIDYSIMWENIPSEKSACQLIWMTFICNSSISASLAK